MESGPLPAVDLAQNSLGSIKPLCNVVAVDLETTGLHSAEDCVIGIGVCFGDTRMDQHRYVRPTAAIAEAVRLGERRGFAKEIRNRHSTVSFSIRQWRGKESLIPLEHVLVCHNDTPKRYGDTARGYCTMEMAQPWGLAFWCCRKSDDKLGMGLWPEHNASDAQATFRVFSAFGDEASRRSGPDKRRTTSVLSNLQNAALEEGAQYGQSNAVCTNSCSSMNV